MMTILGPDGEPIESRATVSTTTSGKPDQWLLEFFGGATAAGVQVSRNTLFTLGAFWKALTLISTDVGRTPLNLWRMVNGRKVLQTDHDAFYLVRHQPNANQRSLDYFQQGTLHKLLYGASYSFKVLDGRGRTVELLPLLPDTVSVFLEGGRRFYSVLLYDDYARAIPYTLDQSQVKVNTWISYDGVLGTGVLQSARELAARMVAMRSFGAGVFKNSARPSVVIKRGAPFKNEAEQESFVRSWQNMYSGAENAHKTAVLPPGAEIQTFGHNAKDSQFIEAEQQCWREVANYFCMPASKLNDMSRSAYNSLEQDALAYLSDCLEGHLVAEEQACNESLLTEQERRNGYFFQFDRKVLRIADMKTMSEYLSKALGNNAAWMTANEARAEIGLDPIDNGDELPTFGQPEQPSTNAPVVNDSEDEDEDEDDSESAMREVLHDAVQRVITRTVNEAKRAYKRGGEAAALGAADPRRDETTDKILSPVLRLVARAIPQSNGLILRLASELLSAVESAAKQGPSLFEEKLTEATRELAERLCK